MRDALIDFLKSGNAPFTLSSLSSSDEVMSAVWECVKSGENREEVEERSEGEKETAARELSALVESLPRLGLVVPVNVTSLKQEVEYEVYTHTAAVFSTKS